METIPEESDEEPPTAAQDDVDEADTIPYAPGDSDDEQFNMAIDDTSEYLMIVMGKPVTTAFVSADVHIPTKKVGCSYVTSQLKEFLNHFPPESREKAFEQIYEILQVLDAYLIDNPQQHIYCMSPDSEYVSLIIYTTKIEIDLCNFLAIWAVLSILLDTQRNKLQHVKSLQQVVDDYYNKCPTQVMSRLEQQSTDIMNVMYDSINNDNFDSISDYTDKVSGAVDNDYDRDDKDNDEMPYDKDNDEIPYDKDKDEMPYDKDNVDMPYDKDNDDTPDDSDNDQKPAKYANDYETAIDEVKYDRNMTNDELKEAKKEKFIETMPMMIQTHLITCKDWAMVKDTAKSLEHIIMKCDPPTPAMPMMATGATVPGLYSYIAHSVDKEEGEIPQPFKDKAKIHEKPTNIRKNTPMPLCKTYQ